MLKFPQNKTVSKMPKFFSKMNKLIVLLSGMLLSFSSFSQDVSLDWKNTFGGNGASFHRVIEAGNGSVIAVGASTTQTLGGKDGLVAIVNYSTGAVVKETRFGGSKDDVIFDVAPRVLCFGRVYGINRTGITRWLAVADR
jgi:hypothetical protein